MQHILVKDKGWKTERVRHSHTSVGGRVKEKWAEGEECEKTRGKHTRDRQQDEKTLNFNSNRGNAN